MYRIRRLGFVPIVILFGACIGRDAPSPESTETIVDDLGRSVEVPSAPRRVVTLAPSLTEVVFAAGAGHLLTAVTTADDYPEEVSEIERIGAFPLNHEAVVAQDPDLILASDQVNSPLDVEPIVDLGIPAVFFRFNTAEEVIDAIRRVGALLGTESHADSVAESLGQRWAAIGSQSTDVEERPRLLLLVGYDILYAFGGDSYTEQMIRQAGAEAVTTELPGQAAVLSDEFVIARAPEVIVVARDTEIDVTDILSHHPSWDVVPAIRNDRVFALDPDLVLRPGPRIIEGTERLSELVIRSMEGGRQ